MARTQTISILFCDLVASTERRARLGDDAFDDFTGRFMSALRDAVQQHDGRIVSTAGDGVMAVFPDSVADAVVCATTMHTSVAALDDDDPPRLRVGISTGEVAQDGDNYSGMPIVEAARLEAAAPAGSTYASAVVRALVGNRRQLHFRDVGPLMLKGIPEALPTVEVVDTASPEPAPVAPTPAPTRDAARRSRPRVVIVAVLVLGVLAFAGAVFALTRSGGGESAADLAGIPAPKGYEPTFETKPCPQEITTEVPDATCGDLVVPQDRSRPDDGPDVRVNVLRAPSRSAETSAAPTISFGAESIATSPVRDHAELIDVGNRGYTLSDPVLQCPELSAVLPSRLASARDDPEQIQSETDAIVECKSSWQDRGFDPANFNIETATLDTLDLMVALEIPSADLLARHQLSALVFGMLRRAPGAIRTITLENPFPNGGTSFTNEVSSLAGAFQRFVAQCDGDAVCRASYPDLEAQYLAIHAGFAESPRVIVANNPAVIETPVPVLMDGGHGAEALTHALSFSTTYSLIPAAIAQQSESIISSEVLLYNQPGLDPTNPWGAVLSYICSYDLLTVDPTGVALAADTAPAFDTENLPTWKRWCQAWDVPPVSDAVSTPIASPVPTLFFRGDISPNGDARWIEMLAARFPNSSTLVFPTLGEEIAETAPSCLAAIRRRFLADPEADLDTVACEKQSPPIPFIAPTG